MPSLSTELTRRLGIRHPVVQGGMHHVGLAPLAGAVSRAGALGIITALSLRSPELLRDEIGKARSIAGADAPVGVNLTLLPTLVPPNYQAYADVCVEERVPVIETAGHIQGLEPFVRLFKSKGAVIVHKCTQVRHARSAAKLGVDMISIDGFECAGHPGEADVGNWVLAPQAARELDVPFIVSGGVATGSQLAAALALGACGVNMGTRFMATTEAPIHDNVKRAIVQGGADSTVLVMRTMRNTTWSRARCTERCSRRRATWSGASGAPASAWPSSTTSCPCRSSSRGWWPRPWRSSPRSWRGWW